MINEKAYLRPWTRHSLVLLVAGLAYAGIGLSLAITKPTPTRESALRLPLHWAPLWFWGVVFMLTGLCSIISARWPPASETWGYSTMTGLAVLWSASYFAGVCLGSDTQNLSGTLVWGLVGFMWWAISGLVAPGSASTYPASEAGRLPVTLTERGDR